MMGQDIRDVWEDNRAKDDPVRWVRRVLGIEPDPAQVEIMKAVAEPGSRVIAEACNGSGKTTVAGMVALWHLARFNPSRVVTLSGGQRQVNSQLWGEIRRMAPPIARKMGWKVLMDSPLIRTNHPETYAIGFSSDDPGRTEGWHSPNLLVIVDEAKSIKARLWDALDSTLTTSTAKMLIITVPGDPDQMPHQKIGTPGYRHVRIIPRCLGIPGGPNLFLTDRVTPTWVEQMKATYGETSAIYRRRVLAESVHVAESPYFAEPLCRKMFTGWDPVKWATIPKPWGLAVDWGRRRDFTVVSEWRGKWGRLLMRTQKDYMELIGDLNLLHQKNGYSWVIADEGEGRGQIDRMKELKLPVEGFNFGSSIDGANAKLLIMSYLHTGMEVGEVVMEPNQVAFDEFMSFQANVTSEGRLKLEAPVGLHDDIVCSCAMGFFRATRGQGRTEPPRGLTHSFVSQDLGHIRGLDAMANIRAGRPSEY